MLVDSLREKGIRDAAVLDAIWRVPRHWFLDKAFADLAYEDKAFPIERDQTISQPYTVARMTELLQVEKRHKVLEIGTGSGYQAVILAALGARVYTVERQKLLYEQVRALLPRIGFPGIRCFFRDGFQGLPAYAPFDRIIVTAAAERIPRTLTDQLGPGGILVIPVGTEVQDMLRITRQPDGELRTERFGQYRFVPFVEGLDERRN
jgi:protein-L-isoaspartate(D-aspartate) O-methyltransferase